MEGIALDAGFHGMPFPPGLIVVLPMLGTQLGLNLHAVSQILRASTGFVINGLPPIGDRL